MDLTFYEWKSDTSRIFVAIGQAKSIFELLRARGIFIPWDVFDRVFECSDQDEMDALLRRALTVERAEDLFASTSQ